MSLNIVRLSIALAIGAAAIGAAAETYPARLVTIVVNSPAGGTADLVARVVKDEMAGALGQQMIIDNRPGAGGMVGARYAARVKPDGYTILWSASPALMFTPLMETHDLGFDPFTDFIYVAPMVDGPAAFVVNRELPVTTLRDFVALVKSQPGKFNYATNGVGTPAHLAAELLQWSNKTAMVHVSYRTAEEAMLAVVKGDGAMFVSSLTTALPFAEEGKVKVLAILGDQRAKRLPDVPTSGEAGFPQLQLPLWHALVAPKDVPDPAVTQLRAAAKQALANPTVGARLEQLGYAIITTPAADFTKRVQADTALWRKVITAANIKME